MMVMLHLFVLAWQEWERREKVGKRPRPWLCPGTPMETVFVWRSPMAWSTSSSVNGDSGS